MPGRLALALGAHSEITVAERPGRDGFYARCSYRRLDGRTVRPEAHGTSRTAAKRALQAKLAELAKAGPSGDADEATTRVRVYADEWLARLDRDVDDGAMSPTTRRHYLSVWRNHVEPAVAELRIGEVTTRRLDDILATVAGKSKDNAATARTILSSLLKLAMKHRALPYNPMADVDRIRGARRDEPKALDRHQVIDLMAKLSESQYARERELPDLAMWMLATSERIGNALAASSERIDLEAHTADVGPIVIRIDGGGLVIRGTEGPKTRRRIIGLPDVAVQMVRRRLLVVGGSSTGLLFPNVRDDGPLDPVVVGRWMRKALDAAGYDWVTPHVFRKTVASTLDAARLSPREVSDRLGHSQTTTTQQHYLRRRADSPAATAALQALLSPEEPRDRLRVVGGTDEAAQ